MKTKKVQLSELRFSDVLLELRKVDPFTVSRYRIAMRSGAQFPRIVVDAASMEIVSGNHTTTAMLEEFGDEYAVEVELRNYATPAEKIADFARHNVGHGRPMDGWTQRKIVLALSEAGQSMEDIAKLLNVPVAHLQKWGDRTVVVMGRKNERKTLPLKGQVVVPTGKMTAAQYERHGKRDIGMSVRALADQLIDRIENEWIDFEDESEVTALCELKAQLNGLDAIR